MSLPSSSSSSPTQTVFSPPSQTFNEQELAKHIRKSTAYYIVNGLPYGVYAVDPEYRKTLVSEQTRKAMSRTVHDWPVYHFRIARKNPSPTKLAALMKLAVGSDSEPHRALSASGPESVFAWHSEGHNTCTLPKCNAAMRGYLVAVFNDDDSENLAVKSSGKSSKVWNIPPKTGRIFQANTHGNCAWDDIADYFVKNKPYNTNPQMRDQGPELAKSGVYPPTASKQHGEQHLTEDMLADLAEHYSSSNTRPPICRTMADVYQQCQSLQPGDRLSLILKHPTTPHMIAARVQRDGDRIVCYLYESLSPDNPVALELKGQVIDALSLLPEHLQKVCMTNGFESQKDFSCCSVFALKALRAFEKYQTTDTLIAEAAQSHIDQRAKKAKRKEPVEVVVLDAAKIPAQLFKMYQGSQKLLTDEHKSTVVTSDDRRMTLAEYRDSHTHNIPNLIEGEETTLTRCLSATKKRYKYIDTWSKLPEDKKTDPAAIPMDCSATELPKPANWFPYNLRYAGSAASAKKLMQETYPEARPLTDHHFRMSCEFEAFVQGNEDFEKEMAKSLIKHLAALLHPACLVDPASRLFREWCLISLENSTYDDPALYSDSPAEAAYALNKVLSQIIQDLQVTAGLPVKPVSIPMIEPQPVPEEELFEMAGITPITLQPSFADVPPTIKRLPETQAIGGVSPNTKKRNVTPSFERSNSSSSGYSSLASSQLSTSPPKKVLTPSGKVSTKDQDKKKRKVLKDCRMTLKALLPKDVQKKCPTERKLLEQTLEHLKSLYPNKARDFVAVEDTSGKVSPETDDAASDEEWMDTDGPSTDIDPSHKLNRAEARRQQRQSVNQAVSNLKQFLELISGKTLPRGKRKVYLETQLTLQIARQTKTSK